MKRFLTSLWVAVSVLTVSAQSPVVPAIPRDQNIERKVDALLQKMTLEEKIGQMTELVFDVIGQYDKSGNKGYQLNEAMLDTVIRKYKVGSILNAPGTTAQTKEKWQEIITRIQEKSMHELGIPCIYGLDQNHGATYTDGGTLFPQNINIAATFNPALAHDAAQITAYETRACSVPWTYSPTIDLGRDPRWPRMWENFGEDCLVNARMGSSAVLGFQGNNPNKVGLQNIAVSLKHYMGYGVTVSGKDRTPSSLSVQEMREKHFAPFLACIRAGALSVMVNSGSNNGMPFHANYELMTQWLKEDLNWDGVLVTDWADINNLYRRDKIAANKKEAIKIAINAGIDMAMEPYEWDFCRLLKQLVNEGQVPMSRIDDAVRRVLRMKYRLGLFEKPSNQFKDYPLYGSKEHAAVAIKAAEESIILLKNTGNILPLSQNKRLLVTGPNANSMRCLNGGWTYTWQGHKTNDFAAGYNTILEALTHKFGKENIAYEPGVTYKESGSYWEENTPEIEKAVAAASNVDYIIACIGENSYCETPGNLSDLTLSRNQLGLVKALAATGKPIVLILNQGRPRIINEIEPLVKAVVNIMLPGNSGGDALAGLLAGDANFSGKMPFTYPKAVHSLATYDYKPSEEVEKMQGAYDYDAVMSVQWALGYGLSYTTFAYNNFSVNKKSFKADDELVFTVDVKNTGTRAGKESVLLFSSDLIASLTPDMRRLRAFEKVELQPGETKSVTLKIKGSDLAFVGYDGKWVLEQGEFRIQTGNQLLNVVCSETHKWQIPNK
jgi:beta-glucosidase